MNSASGAFNQAESFERRWRGYEPRQVDLYREKMETQCRQLSIELEHLRKSLDEKEAVLNRLRGLEQTLQDAILNAQKLASEIQENAQKEAEKLLLDAKTEAGTIQANAARALEDLRWQTEKLHLEKHRFEQRFRTMLQEHLTELDSLPSNLAAVHLEVEDAVV